MSLCECGEPRDPRAEACARCAALDGASEPEARLIAVLRLLDEAGTEELREEAQMAARSVRRTLERLRRLGRIVTEHYRDESNLWRSRHRLATPPKEAP